MGHSAFTYSLVLLRNLRTILGLPPVVAVTSLFSGDTSNHYVTRSSHRLHSKMLTTRICLGLGLTVLVVVCNISSAELCALMTSRKVPMT